MARNENGKGFSLKDELFNQAKVTWLAEQFYKADSNFNKKAFVSEVMKTLLDLELKARINLIANVLKNHLAKDFKVAARQLLAALPPPLDPTKTDDDFGDFIIAPLGEYVVQNGLHNKHLKTSLKVLKELTKRFSMEDAIRYFIREFTEETFAELTLWTEDKNYHVRRLVSEGTRPLLPWSGRIAIDQTRTLLFLDKLYADKTRYVTRSVANHLNDISKTNPALVIKTLKKWQREGKQADKEFMWIARHSLRTLVKQGNVEALKLLGFSVSPAVVMSDVERAPANLPPGETLYFSFKLTAESDQTLLIDYVVDFIKANGKTKPKVHKLKQLKLMAGETVQIHKKHHFHKDATTLTFYKGVHTVTLQINGQLYNSFNFELRV